MGNELAIYDKITDPMAYAREMGTAIAKSGLFGCENESQGVVLAMACICERINPIEFARTYHIIKNRLSLRADAMLAKFISAGGKVKWTNLGDDGSEARGKWSFGEYTDLDVGFSMKDAVRAKLVKADSNWEKWPGEMLRARAITKAIRIVAPHIVAGYASTEELDDGGPAVDHADKKVDAMEVIRQAKAKADAAATAKESEPIDADFTVVPPHADPAIIARLEKYAKRYLTPDQQAGALKRRGATVWHELTNAQATEILDRLLQMELGGAKPVGNEPVAKDATTDDSEAAPEDAADAPFSTSDGQ